MKFSFSNLIAVASIMVWATAWAATEKSAASAENAPQTISATKAKTVPAKNIRTVQATKPVTIRVR